MTSAPVRPYPGEHRGHLDEGEEEGGRKRAHLVDDLDLQENEHNLHEGGGVTTRDDFPASEKHFLWR